MTYQLFFIFRHSTHKKINTIIFNLTLDLLRYILICIVDKKQHKTVNYDMTVVANNYFEYFVQLSLSYLHLVRFMSTNKIFVEQFAAICLYMATNESKQLDHNSCKLLLSILLKSTTQIAELIHNEAPK